MGFLIKVWMLTSVWHLLKTENTSQPLLRLGWSDRQLGEMENCIFYVVISRILFYFYSTGSCQRTPLNTCDLFIWQRDGKSVNRRQMWKKSVTFSLTNQMCLANLASLFLLEVSYYRHLIDPWLAALYQCVKLNSQWEVKQNNVNQEGLVALLCLHLM